MLFRRLRYITRLYLAYLSKYRHWILSSVLITILATALPGNIRKIFPIVRPEQKIGLVGRYNITNLPPLILKKISLGLTSLNSQNQAIPGLAKSWVATDSGLTYKFNLNTDLKWSDGKPLESSDLSFNFSDAIVSWPDKQTILIKLEKFPYSPLPVLVSKPLLRQITPRWPKKIPFIGAGNYRLTSFNQQGDALNSLTLKPSAKNSNLPKLTYHFYSSQNQALTALKLGEVDTLENISDISPLHGWQNIVFAENPNYDKVVTVVFNYKSKYFGGTGGRNFRQVLNFSTDKSVYPYKSVNPIPKTSWAFSKDLKTSSYDPEKSDILFKKIENVPQTITLHTFPGLIATAEKLKTDWSRLNITIEILSVTEIPEDFEMLLTTLPLLPDPDQYHLWHSKSETQNYGKFNSPRIDKLLEDGRREGDLEKRKAIYEDFQKYLLDETPAIFLYHPVTYTITRN